MAETVFYPTVMLVDNDVTCRSMVSASLAKSAVKAVTCDNPDAALTIAQSVYPDLFLVDVNLPGGSGMEFIRRLRREDDYVETPVVALCDHGRPETRSEAFAAGANGFLRKPFTVDELMSCVGIFLTLYLSVEELQA